MNFDNQANKWDSEYRIKRGKVVAAEILKNIYISKNTCAMEFGCGTGLVGLNLINQVKHLHFVDLSQGMLDVLKNKIKISNLNNAYVHCTDIYTEHTTLSSFDLIFTSMALHHMDDINGVLDIFYNKLHSNGQICIVDLNKGDGQFHADEKEFKGHDGFNQDTLKELLIKSGYKNIKSYTFLNDKRVKGNKEVPYSLFILTAEK